MADPRLNKAQAAQDLEYCRRMKELKEQKTRAQIAEALLQPVAEAGEDALPPDDDAAMLNDDEPICAHGTMADLRQMEAKLEEEWEEERRKGNIVECKVCGFDYHPSWISEQGVCSFCEPSAADGNHTSSSQGQSHSSGAEPIADAGGQDQSGAASEPAAADTTGRPAIWL